MRLTKAIPLFVLVLLGLTVLGFWRTYLSQLSNISISQHIHGITMFAWLVILALQARFATAGPFALHKIIGRASFVVVPIILWLMISISHQLLATQPGDISAQASQIAVLGQYIVVMFALAYVLAILNRRTPDLHFRFMIITGILLIEPATFRIVLFYAPGDPNLLLASYGAMVVTSFSLFALAANDFRIGGAKLPFALFFLLTLPKFLLFASAAEFQLWQDWLEFFRAFPALTPWEAGPPPAG